MSKISPKRILCVTITEGLTSLAGLEFLFLFTRMFSVEISRKENVKQLVGRLNSAMERIETYVNSIQSKV